MTNTTENPTKKHSLSYNQQRVFWPFLVGVIAFFLAQNGVFPEKNCAIPAFISYVIAGLFYDWLIFSYLGYKDSEKFTDEQLIISNITGKQLDKTNDFFVMIRRAAFASSMSATAMCVLFFPQASIMGTCFFAYAGITILFISIGMITKEIPFRYMVSGSTTSPNQRIDLFSPIAIDPTSNDPALNPFWTRY